MNPGDLMTGLMWLMISIFICVAGIRLGTGTLNYPGPGFLPFLSGAVLGILAIALTANTLKKNRGAKIRDLWKGVAWGKVIMAVASLSIYVILLPHIGYLITTFVLMTFLFGIISKPKLWIRLVGALITASASYVVFCTWLGLELPKGMFAF